MNADTDTVKKRRPVIRIIVIVVVIVLSTTGIFIYNNFNRLLSEALIKSFDSNIVSDVYELKFEKLRVNIFQGNLRVVNVVFRPRQVPLRSYPYINSSFQLKAEKITLENVRLFELLRSNNLILERIAITRPEIEVLLENLKPVFMPFKDTATAVKQEGSGKKAIDSYGLDKFQLINASFRITNSARQRAFEIADFAITLNDLLISQQPGKDLLSFKHVELSVADFKGALTKGAVKRIGFKDLKIKIDSIKIQKSVDTLLYRFDDLTMGMNSLDMHTADSLFHLTLGTFGFSYKERSINLENLSFKPNISDASMQDRFKFQHTQISGDVRSVKLVNVNFDSLIYYHSLLVDEIVVDKPEVSIFKDNTKPVDKDRFPKYFGQQITAVPVPLRIKHVKITNVNLTNVERKRDSSYAKVAIRRGTVFVENITNLSKGRPLSIEADAYISDKVHFNARLEFSYREPQFGLSGKLEKFNLPDLNPVLAAYTPAKINSGTADEIAFSGTVNWTNASGTMKFLYHDLDVDLDLKEKARWKSSVLAFAANSVVNSSNPGSTKLPPRVVQLHAERDMNKGFVNIVIKSVLNGIKETMIMSKENRKAYNEAKDKAKKERKANTK